MGDFRADIKIRMHLMGKDYASRNMWINWTPSDCCGVDRRIAEFFAEAYEDAHSRFTAQIADATTQGARELEAWERGELERLKVKYEDTA